MRLSSILACAMAATALVAAAGWAAQPPGDGADAVEAVQEKLSRGELRLQHRPDGGGYVPALLEALSIPIDSQLLVFSKTSLQFPLIGPEAPRAIYFNDDTAVGVVQDGRFIEIMTTGADGRVAFYTLEAASSSAPRFERERGACLGCHASADKWAPGMLVANVLPLPDGSPIIRNAGQMFELTDATTPFGQRWGGWYVTGRSGAMRHGGNVQMTQAGLSPTEGLNVTDLSGRFDAGRYLASSSDIVALMTFEHQIGAMNRIWRLQAQERTLGGEGARKATAADIDESVEELVAYLMGIDEAALPSPVDGGSSFTRTFAARGAQDSQGRSLRDFDLQTRLFRYPVSYMVYSRAFRGLSDDLSGRVWRRLYDVLSGADPSPRFKGLDGERRQAALEILRDTHPAAPAYWHVAAPGPVAASRTFNGS